MTLIFQGGIVWYNPGDGFYGFPVRRTHSDNCSENNSH